jgi:hypothetical protein
LGGTDVSNLTAELGNTSADSSFNVFQGIDLATATVSVDLTLPIVSERVQAERSYTHVVFDARSSCYAGTSALEVPYQLYSDECLIIEDPDCASRSSSKSYLLVDVQFRDSAEFNATTDGKIDFGNL